MLETSALNEVRFDKEIHACWLGKERLPSVGTIMRKAAKAYNPWAKDDITPEAKARMDRGRVIHETLELYDRGILKECDPACEPYIDAMRSLKGFFGIWRWGGPSMLYPESDGIEEWVASPEHRFWGIIDRWHPLYGVIDIKTGSSRQSSYRVQVAGYCILKGAAQGKVVYLPGDRKLDPDRDIERITDDDFTAFQSALWLAARAD